MPTANTQTRTAATHTHGQIHKCIRTEHTVLLPDPPAGITKGSRELRRRAAAWPTRRAARLAPHQQRDGWNAAEGDGRKVNSSLSCLLLHRFARLRAERKRARIVRAGTERPGVEQENSDFEHLADGFRTSLLSL